MTFWILTAALATVVAATLALIMVRSRANAIPAAAYDMQVYRDQLNDVERDLARGLIAKADADRVRTEVSRRLLAADAKLRSGALGTAQSPVLSRGVAVFVALCMIAGSLALYQWLGAPGYGDLSLKRRIALAETARTTRPDQQEAEVGAPPSVPLDNLSAEYRALITRLRETVAERPDDLQGQTLLARNEAALGNFTTAHAAQERVLALKGADATAQDYVDYADMMIQATGGYVSPQAEAALRTALELDRKNPVARFYWGLTMAQIGRPDIAFAYWNDLLREGPADAPWMVPIRDRIEDMAMRAGVQFVLPPELEAPEAQTGPSAGDVAAASDMTEAERSEMIRGMVDNLSDRLATEGGPPPEWARLIGALSVLGEVDQARAIHDNARTVFADSPQALQVVDDAARQAGLIE